MCERLSEYCTRSLFRILFFPSTASCVCELTDSRDAQSCAVYALKRATGFIAKAFAAAPMTKVRPSFAKLASKIKPSL